MKNLTLNIVNLLNDGLWHSNMEILRVGGHRFGGRLHQLKKEGFVFEKKPGEGYIEYWKLISKPYYEIRGSKMMTLTGMVKREIKKQNKEKQSLLNKILHYKLF